MPTITQTPLATPTIGADPVPAPEVYLPIDPVFVKVFDDSAGTYTDLSTEANNPAVNDVPLLPDPLGANDLTYIGGSRKFDTILINMGIAGAGTYGAVWEYHNGSSWVSLSFLYDSVGEIVAFKVSGHWALFIEPPSNIVRQTVNNQSAFWIRQRITSPGAGYTQPVATQIWLRLLPGAGQIIRIQVT